MNQEPPAVLAARRTMATAGAANPTPQAVTTCGSTVTGYAILTSDLTCASGNGVTLTGDATLDLGGYTLTGPSPSMPSTSSLSAS